MKRYQVLEWAGNLFGIVALLGIVAAVGIAVYGIWQFGFYWELLVQVALVLVGSFFCLALADLVTLLLDLYDRLVQLPTSQKASAYPAQSTIPAPAAPRGPS